jgi:hypothetical protein
VSHSCREACDHFPWALPYFRVSGCGRTLVANKSRRQPICWFSVNSVKGASPWRHPEMVWSLPPQCNPAMMTPCKGLQELQTLHQQRPQVAQCHKTWLPKRKKHQKWYISEGPAQPIVTRCGYLSYLPKWWKREVLGKSSVESQEG